MSACECKKDIVIPLIFFFSSLLVFTCGLSNHGLEYRDDEIFYFKSTQEMLTTGNFLSPTYFGENRFQKPILFYWLILLSCKVFGVNWFAARFVSAFFGSLSVTFTWLIARQFFDRKLAALSSLMLMTVPLFFRHAKNAVPDMAFNFFILLSIWSMLKFFSRPFPANQKYSILFFLTCALGFMIKGPAAVLIPTLILIVCVFLFRKYSLLREINFPRGLGILLLITLPWFLYMLKAHGLAYLEYMWVNETKYRIMGGEPGNILFESPRRLMAHPLFYFKVILFYFAPWSLFFFLAVIFFFIRMRREGKHFLARRQGISFFMIWAAVVFLFFSSMYFVINHYLLIMTTPFAILVSYFLMGGWKGEVILERMILSSRKYFLTAIIALGWLGCSFFFIFFLGMPKSWVIIFFLLYGASMCVVYKINENVLVPFILSFFMLSMIAPSSFFLGKAGLSAHATFMQFVKTIEEGLDNQTLIAVGSHDIHEKEVQVFFDRPVRKSGWSDDPQTRMELASLFAWPGKVYCFILQKDYEKFIKDKYQDAAILQEEYIIRKRFFLDARFFMAILRMDQQTVRNYLLEKILLIEKKSL